MTSSLRRVVRLGALIPALVLGFGGCGDVDVGASTGSGAAIQADTTDPSPPGNFSAVAASATRVNLSWSAATDNVGVSDYIVNRNGAQVASTAATNYADTGVLASATYTYSVAARDAAGNVSRDSASRSVTTPAAPTPDTLAPTVPASVGAAPGINSISVSWSPSSDDVGVAGYTVRRDTVVVATSGSTTYLDTGLAASTTFSYTVSAFDAAGNASAQSAPVAATTAAAPPPDTLPPTMPGNLAATPSTNAISLTWSAATDNIGVTGYVVRRGGTPVATRTVTNYLDTGLVASTSYSYTVSAVDAEGNESPETAPVAATTLAAGTPSVLAQLAASLAPGQWATLNANNFNLALVNAGDARSILEFASRGHWDPVHKKIQFWGEGHFAGQALITYDDATNTWSKDTTVVNSNIGHGYQHLALNPANGDLYLRLYSSGTIRKKPYGQAWQNAAPFNNNNQQVAGALEWFPQLNGGAGGLAFADTGGVRFSNAAVSSWGSQINAASGPYHNNGVATNGAFYFGDGNGSSAFWRLAPNGTVTAAASAPVQYGVTARHLVAHPNGVDALLVGPAGNGNVYRYNGASNSWTNLGAHQLNADTWWAGIVVPEYGVTVWLCQDSSVSSPTIRVYKP